MQNVHTENGKFKAERIFIHYGQVTVIEPYDPIYLAEYLRAGFVSACHRNVVHLLHPAAQYHGAH